MTAGQSSMPAKPLAKPTYARYNVTAALYVNMPTSDGTISNAAPVAALLTAAKTNTRFITLALRFCLRLRFELEGQLVDLPRERERNIVAILDHRDACARILANVEGFVLRNCHPTSPIRSLPAATFCRTKAQAAHTAAKS